MSRGSSIIALLAAASSALGSTAAFAEDDQVVRRLVVDGGFIGDLPEPVIDHGGGVFDDFGGNEVARDEPVFDVPRTAGMAGPWIEGADSIQSATMAAPGFSRDQTEPRLAIYDGQRFELTIWGDGSLADGPRQRFEMRRTIGGSPVPDALVGTRFERFDATHRIRSGTMLPGLLMVLMEQTVVNLEVDPPSSAVRGITIGAMQESTSGAWEWVWVEDVPNDAPLQAEEHPRLALSSMTAYYPTTRDPGFLEAFVPFVDYMQHTSREYAVGGQCGLVRVQRSEVGAAWSFGPVKEIVSSWGTVQEHYHAAGWTPNGLVLSIGDSTRSRLALLRCEDWGRYEDSGLWTAVPRWQGGAGEDQVLVNQFWAVAPGNELNQLLVGGDNVGGAIYAVDVPPAGDDDPTAIRRLGGVQSALNLGGFTGNTTSWIHRSRPEENGPVIARFSAESMGYPDYCRTLMSRDGTNFAAVARLPESGDRLSLPMLHGDRILLHRFDPDGIPGFRGSLAPATLPLRRGLLVRPGGCDFLRDESGTHRAPDSLEVGPGFSVVQVPADQIPGEARGWVVPPDAVCYRVTGRASAGASTILNARIEDPRSPSSIPDAEAFAMNLMVCNLRPSRVILRGELLLNEARSSPDPGGDCLACCGPSTEKRTAIGGGKYLHLNSMLDWTHADVWGPTFPSGGRDVRFTLTDPTGSTNGTIDVLLVMRSLVSGAGQPSWTTDPAPERVVPADRVHFPLPLRGDTWAAGIELQVPSEGPDFSIGSRMKEIPLCTWWFPGGDFISVRNMCSTGRFTVVTGGAAGASERTFGGFDLNREDVLRLELRGVGRDVRLAIDTGSVSASEVAEWSIPVFGGRAPVRLAIGGDDGEVKGALVVREVWTRVPRRSSSLEIVPPPIRPSEGVGREERSRTGDPGIDVMKVLLALGRRDVDLPRHLDIDGDGEVTILDLESAMRIVRSQDASPGSGRSFNARPDEPLR